MKRTDSELRDLGILVLSLAGHTPGDYGDCSINHPVVTIIDRGEPAGDLLRALSNMTPETVAGLVEQEGSPQYKNEATSALAEPA